MSAFSDVYYQGAINFVNFGHFVTFFQVFMLNIFLLQLCVAVNYSIICSKCHPETLYRLETDLFLALMALKGIFVFISVWVRTYQEGQNYGMMLKSCEM